MSLPSSAQRETSTEEIQSLTCPPIRNITYIWLSTFDGFIASGRARHNAQFVTMQVQHADRSNAASIGSPPHSRHPFEERWLVQLQECQLFCIQGSVLKLYISCSVRLMTLSSPNTVIIRCCFLAGCITPPGLPKVSSRLDFRFIT